MRKYRCSKCGYITEGEISPKKCPTCGSLGDCFEEIGVERQNYVQDDWNRKSR